MEENAEEEELGYGFQLLVSFPPQRLPILSLDFVCLFVCLGCFVFCGARCLYSVCYVLDSVIGTVDLPKLYHLWLLLI